jgi:hypothetical protein
MRRPLVCGVFRALYCATENRKMLKRGKSFIEIAVVEEFERVFLDTGSAAVSKPLAGHRMCHMQFNFVAAPACVSSRGDSDFRCGHLPGSFRDPTTEEHFHAPALRSRPRRSASPRRGVAATFALPQRFLSSRRFVFSGRMPHLRQRRPLCGPPQARTKVKSKWTKVRP